MTAGRNEWVRDQFTVRAINYVDKHRKLHGPRRVCNHCEAAGVARPQSYSMQTTVPNLIKHFKKHRSVLAEFTRLFPVIIDDSDDIDQCSVVSSTTFSSSGSSRGSGSDMSTYHPPSKQQTRLSPTSTLIHSSLRRWRHSHCCHYRTDSWMTLHSAHCYMPTNTRARMRCSPVVPQWPQYSLSTASMFVVK